MNKRNLFFRTTLILFFLQLFYTFKVYAAKTNKINDVLPDIPAGHPIQFGTIDNLLWSIIATIQLYTLPVMAITIAFLGIKLVMSGDDTSSKEVIKSWIGKILFGGVLVFSASTIASIIKAAVGG